MARFSRGGGGPNRVRSGQRRLVRASCLASSVLTLVTVSALAAPPAASAEPAVSPKSGVFTVSGAGFGHGLGMSQYGAYGAARRGLTWKQILAFYYPGTRLADLSDSTLRVWVSADTDGDLKVRGTSGLRLRDASGHAMSLPTGAAYHTWRVSRSGAGYKLAYRSASGGWKTKSTPLGTSTWRLSTTGSPVRVVLPGGAVRSYRGSVALAKRGSSGRTVNYVSLDNYVRGVVPAEMPTSWAPDAVRAQAVAARTYAAKLRSSAGGGTYDICDTTACQVYRGAGYETSGGNAATAATAGKVLKYGSSLALTMFASSDGGWTTQGPYPYLRAHSDPYDGVITPQTWTRRISASSVGRRWSVGSVRQLRIIKRDGYGRWGGRVLSMQVIGSRRTVTITGSTFQHAFGLRSNYFTVGKSSGAPTATPTAAPMPVKPGKAYATFPRSYNATSRVDLLLVTAAGALLRHPVSGGRVGTPVSIGNGFGGYTHVVNAGDWNGDGYQDVIARTSTERLLLFRGTATGRLAAAVDLGLRSNHLNVTSVGDANGDRHPDLLVMSTAGGAFLVYGNGRTGITGYRAVAADWSALDWLRGVGDFDGDGRPDAVARKGTGLYLLRGTKAGFAAPVSLRTSTSDVVAIGSPGDVSGDGHPDIVARTATGSLRLYRGDGHRLSSPTTLSGSYARTRFAL